MLLAEIILALLAMSLLVQWTNARTMGPSLESQTLPPFNIGKFYLVQQSKRQSSACDVSAASLALEEMAPVLPTSYLLEENINPSDSFSDTASVADSSEVPSSVYTPEILPEQSARIPSLALRTRTETISSITSTSSSPVRRKPLPVTASPLTARFSSGEYLTSKLFHPEQPFTRPYTVDSPTLHEFPPTNKHHNPATEGKQSLWWRPAVKGDALTTNNTNESFHHPAESEQPALSSDNSNLIIPPTQTLPKHARLTSESGLTIASRSTTPWLDDSSSITNSRSTMSMFSPKPTPLHINVSHTQTQGHSKDSFESDNTIQKAQPKSPGISKLGHLLGWGGTSPDSTTTFDSEQSLSPLPSPGTSEFTVNTADAANSASIRNVPAAIDVPKANAEASNYFGSTTYLQLPLATPTTPTPIEAMEKEVRDVAMEMMTGLKREMELEVLCDNFRAQINKYTSAGKRTSDYFSDSGTSSVKYGEEQEFTQATQDRAVRQAEREKASIICDLSTSLQDERARRKHVEARLRDVEEKASQVDLASINSMDANGRLQKVQEQCDILRRRLGEEKEAKENFEILLSDLKIELSNSNNERDNLRDEVIPQLRARIEGLEAQAAEHEQLTYEQSRMQQEVQALKTENQTLITAQRMQQDMQQQMMRFNSIVEENGSPASTRSSIGLMRSNSVAQGPRGKSGSLSRSVSVKGGPVESREALAEKVKDVETQRDAFRDALEMMKLRQKIESMHYEKRIRQLEQERDRALGGSRIRLSYENEVATLRERIVNLRKRADEALDQKDHCENQLSGVKMDLQRAKQEIGSLKDLLSQKDILAPTGSRQRSRSGSVSSESLERAFRELHKSYEESLDKVKMEMAQENDDNIEKAMQDLERSLRMAIEERDFAQKEIALLRHQSQSLQDGVRASSTEVNVLADDLRKTADRVQELATSVRQQLAVNAGLRHRLAETVDRGEQDQKNSAELIMSLQRKLKDLEEQLMAAQQISENKVYHHEDELRELSESHNKQLQRMKGGLKSPRLLAPTSSVTPLLAGSTKAPMIMATSSGKAMTVSEHSEVEVLRQKILELEKANADADLGMEEVMGRLNVAQMEVMELQNEREEAVRETKRLRQLIEDEKARASML